ncbi:MAG: S8 family serine peptidase [Actinomycetota bacterium]
MALFVVVALFVSTVLAGATSAASPETVPVRVPAGGLARAGVTPTWVAHYGSFDWAELHVGDLDRLRAAEVAFEVRRDVRRLILPGATFDPLEELSTGAATAGGGPELWVVQLRGPTKDRWLDQLRARGGRLVQYIAPFSYVSLLDPDDADRISALPFVRWTGAFSPLYSFGYEPSAGAFGAILLDDGRLADSLDLMQALGLKPVVTGRSRFGDVDGVGVALEGTAAALRGALSLPNLYSISPIRTPKLRDELSDQVVAGNVGPPIKPGYRRWLESHRVSGKGVVVAHVDSGVDMNHPDLVDRIHGCIDYVAGGLMCSLGQTDGLGHGTHTAGIIVATGSTGGSDENGFLYGLGVAPGAKLFVQNFVATGASGPSGPGQYIAVNRDSVLGGATISANSWGPSGSPQGYDADTREFDFAPRDANLRTRKPEPLTFVLSIMNGGGGTSSQGTPDEGKNLLRVGGTQSPRSGSIRNLGSFTAHGPALDGRRLPDLVAPGESVVSTRSSAGALCSSPPPDVDGLQYSTCTGTSMASPHVSGGAALFTEYFRRRTGSAPSPALVKAAFINGAIDLAGGKDANGGLLGHIPDDRQGWGRFDLENVLGGPAKVYLDQGTLFRESGENVDVRVRPVDPRAPVKITLVWTDAPGHGLGGKTPAWVNDLDLRVSTGDHRYLGNVFGRPSTGWSHAGGRADFKNNVENVYLMRARGLLAIEVLAANLAGDGVPGNGDVTDQDFALVISNARVVPGGEL